MSNASWATADSPSACAVEIIAAGSISPATTRNGCPVEVRARSLTGLKALCRLIDPAHSESSISMLTQPTLRNWLDCSVPIGVVTMSVRRCRSSSV